MNIVTFSVALVFPFSQSYGRFGKADLQTACRAGTNSRKSARCFMSETSLIGEKQSTLSLCIAPAFEEALLFESSGFSLTLFLGFFVAVVNCLRLGSGI